MQEVFLIFFAFSSEFGFLCFCWPCREQGRVVTQLYFLLKRVALFVESFYNTITLFEKKYLVFLFYSVEALVGIVECFLHFDKKKEWHDCHSFCFARCYEKSAFSLLMSSGVSGTYTCPSLSTPYSSAAFARRVLVRFLFSSMLTG